MGLIERIRALMTFITDQSANDNDVSNMYSAKSVAVHRDNTLKKKAIILHYSSFFVGYFLLLVFFVSVKHDSI